MRRAHRKVHVLLWLGIGVVLCVLAAIALQRAGVVAVVGWVGVSAAGVGA